MCLTARKLNPILKEKKKKYFMTFSYGRLVTHYATVLLSSRQSYAFCRLQSILHVVKKSWIYKARGIFCSFSPRADIIKPIHDLSSDGIADNDNTVISKKSRRIFYIAPSTSRV
ncbi:hypothetical protein PUN28_013420 [Cardiocondyla obscurior]|uniref:Uncharacterized protein n=1 Tax=Cardiocondyla obscurior TaxID=286306 RepID=A0AAW2FDA9_9HYME